VATRGSDFQRALGMCLPFDVGEVGIGDRVDRWWLTEAR
jgi:hypothetical protein